MSRLEENQESDKLCLSSEFKKKLFERINGISAAFNVAYPINPKLRYEYPPINATTLENISYALITNPNFYTQTLHLMNKMNLPCPLVSYIRQPKTNLIKQPENFNLSQVNEDYMSVGGESEVESEIEIDYYATQNIEYNLSQTEKSLPPKKLKLKEFLSSKNPEKKKKIELTEVFEAPDVGLIKNSNKNQIKMVKEVYDRQIIQIEDGEGFAKIIPIDRKVEDFVQISNQEPEMNDTNQFISRSELEKNRLKISELKELSVYKNYSRGEQNSRIYLKNLAKTVVESDLRFIYGRYINWKDESQVNAFDIRLMQEGRMKGQAFITLPNEDIAYKALEDTNGYLLKDKPIVISFARSAKPK